MSQPDATPALAELQQKLQHQFADQRLLERALTHRSASPEHNERLEFLGDSVLNLAAATLLHQALKDTPEGELSRIRANLVKQETLFQLALELNVASVLRLGDGEIRSGGQRRPSILADALEAIIGAVYIDAGYACAESLILRLFDQVQIKPSTLAAKDPKTELQEWLQARRMRLPLYRVLATQGAAHLQSFDVECQVTELALSECGSGNSRRAGEQAAAAAMLHTLKVRSN